MSDERLESRRAEFYIDLAIHEQERQRAAYLFRQLCYRIVHNYLEGDNGLELYSREATIPSPVDDIKLRAFLHHEKPLATSPYIASIEGTVSQKTQPNLRHVYKFSLDQNSCGEDKRKFISLDEIQKAIKRAEFIEKTLRNRF